MSEPANISSVRVASCTAADLLATTINFPDADKQPVMGKLTIPEYQRPYVWGDKQLSPLIEDLKSPDKKPLLMGCVILHEKDEDDGRQLNIVDGQQRLLTLAILQHLLNQDTQNQDTGSPLLETAFPHATSQEHLRHAAATLAASKDAIDRKVFERIRFVVVVTHNIADAFAFFDSQNTRGVPLAPWDVLKAHHLRVTPELYQNDCVASWEGIQRREQGDQKEGDPGQLGVVLATLLERGRRWSRGGEALTSDLMAEFRALRKKSTENPVQYWQTSFAGTDPTQAAQWLDAAQKALANPAADPAALPFSAVQLLAGGEQFFWYTAKYAALHEQLMEDQAVKDFSTGIPRENTGTEYTYMLWMAALLFYRDKFGYQQFREVTEALFFAVFRLRMQQATVQAASVNKFVREVCNPFAFIRDAALPESVIDTCRASLQGFDEKQGGGIRAKMREKTEWKKFETWKNNLPTQP